MTLLDNFLRRFWQTINVVFKCVSAFKSIKTAHATIKVTEVMHALCKGQAEYFYYGQPLGEVRLVNRTFGL